MSFFSDHLEQIPVLAVLRGLSPEDAVAASETLWAAGVELVEITIQDQAGFDALSAVVTAADGRLIGAGSVTTAAQVERIAAMGVDFAVSPGLDPVVVEASADAGLPYLPGVATPSEVQIAVSLGCYEMKLFPAGLLGGPAMVRALLGPFPGCAFVVTGGVGVGDLDAYMSAGALGVGLGSTLTQAAGMQELQDWVQARD